MAKKNHNMPPIQELYKTWYEDYSSYVVQERAIPNLEDGLKPSQRRCLQALKDMDDGRYNKLANVVGHTMAYHPHGDIALIDTFVTMAQKGWLIDTQGNWGNTITGEGNAAQRYIECRLTPFAKDILFSPKITKWKKTYDGRRDEPIRLPAKFPLLLLQGTEGIAVALACTTLPHNFREITEACIAYLKNEPFSLIPDFPSGGDADISDYLDGTSKGRIRVRAKIETKGKNQLVITELPYSVTSTKLLENIVLVAQKGKIKVKEVEDLSVETPEVVVTLAPGSDLEKSREALFAFTKCEVSIATNNAVIRNGKPWFCSTTELLKANCEHIKELIAEELRVHLQALDDKLMKMDLEKIFIEKEIYNLIKPAQSLQEAKDIILTALQKEIPNLRREPTPEEITALTEIQIRKIAAFDQKSHQRSIEITLKEEKETLLKLSKINKTTIAHFETLLKKYGHLQPRKTRLHPNGFKPIDLAEVDAQSMPTYWNPNEGFIGTSLKKEEALPFEVTPMTDVVAINQHGITKINRIGPKTFFAENLLDARILTKNGEAPTYHLIYEEKTSGKAFAKSFQITGGFVRDKPYLLAGKDAKNKILFLEITPPGQKPPKVTVLLQPETKAKIKEILFDFQSISVKNREALGNTLTKYPIKKIKKI